MDKLIKVLLISILTLAHISVIHAQVCAIPGNDGDNLALSGTINTFWRPANGTYDATDTTIPIQNRRGSATNITSGDLVLIIQMQCANINITDTDAYGDGISGDTEFGSVVAHGYADPVGTCLAGQYEYVKAGPLSNATTLDLSENPLVHTYVQANATATTSRRTFQVVRVPQYDNATLSGNITTLNWNRFSGGIIVLDITRTLDLATNNVNANGRGFRGGGGRARSSVDAVNRYRWDVDDRHASKGEGIAGTPRFLSNKRNQNATSSSPITDLGVAWRGYPDGTSTNGDFARGAPANAGGGGNFWQGNSDNGGGGGGSNGGEGGRGGAGWRSGGYATINVDYSNHPEKKWGFGGSIFSSASVSRLIMGGGGGAGDNNSNSTPEQSSGAAGGGIVMIRARLITGSGRILARGTRATENPLNDAAGGGGAGGSVLIVASDTTTSTMNVNVSGGIGASAWPTGGSAHGGGGGGGGGVIIRTGAVTANINGAINGITNTGDSPSDGANHGAKPGATGINSLINVTDDTPGINTGFRCLDFGDAPTTYGLVDHNLGSTPENLFLGTIKADGNPAVLTAIPSTNADADDANDIDDEDGTTLPTSSTSDGTYTISMTVFNNTGSNANLCGWIDFDQDGSFQSDEAICTVVSSIAVSQSINLVFTVAIADRDNTGKIVGRFRLTTDALTTTDSMGSASNGEVEDHVVNVTTLPVSINGFESTNTEFFTLIKWNTASETRNIGFNLWADDGNGFVKINEKIIPSKSHGVLKPQNYQFRLKTKTNKYKDFAISAINTSGKDELFGVFTANKAYGRASVPLNINWKSINHELNTTLKSQATAILSKKSQNLNPKKARLKTNAYGMHRLTYKQLLDAGFDLKDVQNKQIAITLDNKPISRWIGRSSLKSTNKFSSNSYIDFWVRKPEYPNALYIDHNTYEISINKKLAKRVGLIKPVFGDAIESYKSTISINDNNHYSFTNTSTDPWYAKQLRDFGSQEDKIYNKEFIINSQIASQFTAKLSAKVIGGTDLPLNPDHEITLSFNGNDLKTVQFNGIESKEISAQIPIGMITQGVNHAQLKLTSGTGAEFDIVLVDEISLNYQKPISFTENILLIENNRLTNNIEISSTPYYGIAAYGHDTSNRLIKLPIKYKDENSVLIANLSGTADYWISTPDKLNSVDEITLSPINNLINNDDNADFLIIAHPLFIPKNATDDHPLNTYIQHRNAQGWKTNLVSIKDIQNLYTSGMPVPQALTRYLRQANIQHSYSHILLVGSDSYDYMDNLGYNSVSFIPTKYTSTLFITHTPSDALLSDLNNDGLSDKAIGRWPVRSLEGLKSIVYKTLQWDDNNDLQAIFITDFQDSINGSFEAQADSLISVFQQSAWESDAITKIFTDNLETNNNQSKSDKARELLFEQWQTHKTVTNFIGHGSPTQWSKNGILNASDIDELINDTTPTLISTLTCYTSYFVSPETNTLAHKLINSSSGAVAIHGAASLSGYKSNEFFTKQVSASMLSGETLGQAIRKARNQAQNNGYRDQVINWTLLGDPTIRLK